MLENAVHIQATMGYKMQQMFRVFSFLLTFFFFEGTTSYPKKKPDPKSEKYRDWKFPVMLQSKLGLMDEVRCPWAGTGVICAVAHWPQQLCLWPTG